MTRTERARLLLSELPQIYPTAHCELDYTSPLELLVATILSAQCTDVRVNRVTKPLFQKYRTAADYASADPETLEQEIYSTGFYRAKAKNIRATGKVLAEKYGGVVPRTLTELAALPGVGRKTANVVLGNAFDLNEGIVVDTHVTRVSRRLGLTRQLDPVKIERDLIPLFPRDVWCVFSHWLIWHGRRRCMARKPDCPVCELAYLCPSAGKAN